jgi:NTE family protein
VAIERALVLSGGSIKGAFQAGAIAHVLTKFDPQIIVGTSVGSLNGGFLADRAGRATGSGQIDWPSIGTDLENFWRDRITAFSCIGRKRSLLSIAFSFSKRFNGLLDMAPLRKLVHDELSAENLRRSPVAFEACAVNLATGNANYADSRSMDILEYIIASTAIPLIMPITMIGSEPFWDGGIREVAPLRKAIKMGATKIICIACDATSPGGVAIPAGRAPFMTLAGRLMEIVVSEILNNDIENCTKLNQYVSENP